MKKAILILVITSLSVIAYGQDVSKLYNQVVPSVVTITVESKDVVTDQSTMTKSMVSTQGLGAGVVISQAGEIMTAAHVIEAAESVKVTFNNGEEVPANIVTQNVDADVALIKLVWIPKDMKIAKLGDSDEMKIGNQVIVIGAPLGLEHSLSVGTISGRMISDHISDNFTQSEFFQTDAAINHGNSGGPMFNMKGEVVGIVSFILSQSGGFEGIGFAATSNLAKEELLGKQPFWFGVTFEPLIGPVAEIFNVPQNMGLLIQKVASNSPAELAGIRPGIFEMNLEGNQILAGGDIVLKVGEYTMDPEINWNGLRDSLSNMKAGSQLPITVLRSGQIKELVLIVPKH